MTKIISVHTKRLVSNAVRSALHLHNIEYTDNMLSTGSGRPWKKLRLIYGSFMTKKPRDPPLSSRVPQWYREEVEQWCSVLNEKPSNFVRNSMDLRIMLQYVATGDFKGLMDFIKKLTSPPPSQPS